ncbi:Tetratricopeptide repeat-containing protein [Flaviramulus basaltis]|uniref:Tetratricopeptide repeat-containing protein n=1 Tax=Flaviramulus basaltis TaxID=369401 RepID=A0A1K2IFP1_9FLAO|nr:tetratricopeptide repeat protein [Flaviramulus basaltis]SFZ90523.1 Tetratricopeptide repeat-containing protein [Flaviramulus basaltis]
MRLLLIIFFFITTSAISQSDLIAKEYFKNGEYEKALIEYNKLYQESTSNINYINQIISTHQQLEQYNEAEAFIIKLIERINYPAFMVELGYNYQLKNDLVNANINYQKAIESIDLRASNVFSVARNFQDHSLLNEAIIVYEKAMVINPDYNFNVQLAQIYGEQGNIEKMFNSYVNFAETNSVAVRDVKRALNDFITEDSNNENNILFRKILLKKIQQQPNLLWNELLSWLFIQQKDFKKAFIQEKAIFNRNPETLSRIEELALISLNENENETAKEIFTYITETAQDADTKLDAYNNLLQLEIKESSKDNYTLIKNKYLELINTFGKQSQTLNLQIAYAHFLAFYMNETNEATSFLEETLKLPITELQKAEVKLELGDVLVLEEKFNQALIYYTQIQRNLKNSTVSQEARFKVAKTSYYKGDFKWAESQLKILKSSTSQLIANDALDLKLLISDNKYEDSLQTALKMYAKADLLAFQNKNDDAINLLDRILNEHKTEPIIAQTLFKQAQLFQLKSQFEKAQANYENIIANYREGILIDDAYFNLAEIYEKHLNMPEKAKALYEQIIFNHSDSIYFVDARKRFRALRGDAIN